MACLLNTLLEGQLAKREQQNSFRRLPAVPPLSAIDFCSNDYLGMSKTGLPALYAKQGGTYPTGSTGSRLLSGNSAIAHELESTIARHHHAESALLFNSGYDANLGLLSAIAHRHAAIFYDQYCHASLLDGIRLGIWGEKHAFHHNDMHHLEQQLAQNAATGKAPVIVAEALYSMDGDFAPLNSLVHLAAQYGAALIIDEAHSTAVYGANGAGLVVEHGLQQEVWARVHTYGKAMGCHGAAVVGSKTLTAYLVNFARSFIYTTALPPHAVALLQGAYNYLAGKDYSTTALQANIAHYCGMIQALNLPNFQPNLHSPIQTIPIPGNDACRSLAAYLQSQNIYALPILSPTVPVNQERIRITLHSYNTFNEIQMLIEKVKAFSNRA